MCVRELRGWMFSLQTMFMWTEFKIIYLLFLSWTVVNGCVLLAGNVSLRVISCTAGDCYWMVTLLFYVHVFIIILWLCGSCRVQSSVRERPYWYSFCLWLFVFVIFSHSWGVISYSKLLVWYNFFFYPPSFILSSPCLYFSFIINFILLPSLCSFLSLRSLPTLLFRFPQSGQINEQLAGVDFDWFVCGTGWPHWWSLVVHSPGGGGQQLRYCRPWYWLLHTVAWGP